MLSRVGETRQSFSGQMMTIIAYRNYEDIDVQFESGKIASHCRYQHFLLGNISENKNSTPRKRRGRTHIGETRIAKNGLKMKIVSWNSSHKIDIEFEDGYRRSCNYTHFLDGKVAHPNITTSRCGYSYQNKDRIGETKILNSGRQAEIIDYIDSRVVRVKIIDTGEVQTKTYEHFRRGCDVRKVFPYKIDTVLVEKLAYIHKNESNFYCTCKKCGISDIMNLNEIKEHKC